MFTKNEATKERVDAYVAALQHEKDGYERRLENLENDLHDMLTSDQLKKRVEAVERELERVSKTAKTSSRAKS